jgi:hypothetical protein
MVVVFFAFTFATDRTINLIGLCSSVANGEVRCVGALIAPASGSERERDPRSPLRPAVRGLFPRASTYPWSRCAGHDRDPATADEERSL